MLNIDDDECISLLMKKKNKDTDRGNAVLCYTGNKYPQVVHFQNAEYTIHRLYVT